jgi:predicted adenylyl cyclase CyaB
MARNVEIKARIASVEALLPRVAAIADDRPVEIFQDDTFFNCQAGRLKLRAFSESDGELIYYSRPDIEGPKQSFYVVSPSVAVASLREALTLAYGECGRIRKHRTLLLVGRTRVHLDRVEGLGDFLEIEVVLAAHEDKAAGIVEARALMRQLDIAPAQLIDRAYVDLAVAAGVPRSTARAGVAAA